MASFPLATFWLHSKYDENLHRYISKKTVLITRKCGVYQAICAVLGRATFRRDHIDLKFINGMGTWKFKYAISITLSLQALTEVMPEARNFTELKDRNLG